MFIKETRTCAQQCVWTYANKFYYFIGGKRYFVTFVDDHTRFYKEYFVRSKAEVYDKFKEFKLHATNEYGLYKDIEIG